MALEIEFWSLVVAQVAGEMEQRELGGGFLVQRVLILILATEEREEHKWVVV
jgi:hypothetical protein